MEKKAIVKDIIRALHAGLPADQAAERVLKEAGFITTAEIAAIEQELMDEGVEPAEIQKFCNVHALIFEKAAAPGAGVAASSSLIDLFKAENAVIKKLTSEVKRRLEKREFTALPKLLDSFDLVIRHYVKKEQALFPFLEKRGFTGPSKVMWGKHDEVRRLLKETRTAVGAVAGPEAAASLRQNLLEPLLAEIEGMVDKEELILFPTSLEKLTPADLAEAQASFIALDQELVEREQKAGAALEAAAPAAAPTGAAGEIVFPSGRLSLTELTRILNVLPVDVSFVDAEDEVKYFSETAERIFPRPRSVIGRQVRHCHPPKSLKAVEDILKAFKENRKDSIDFWINLNGKMVLIRYVAIRDGDGKYLGTLEVTQDITGLRALTGEKRLANAGEL